MRPLITAIGLLLGWEALAWATGVPSYILPPPSRVVLVLIERLPQDAAGLLADLFVGSSAHVSDEATQ